MPGPLRKIVKRRPSVTTYDTTVETLECGHENWADTRASYAAQKRRCRECAAAPQPDPGGAEGAAREEGGP